MLAPNPETILTQLNADYAVNSFLMAWSHTLLNTSLHPLDPKPAWYDRIAGELGKAKAVTQPWLIEEYPKIAAALPQSLIDYGNNALPALEAMLAELAKSAPRRQVLIGLVEELQQEARDQQRRVTGLRDKVAAYAPQAAAVARQAAKEAQEVIASAGASNKKVLSLQARIADLQHQLGGVSADAKNAMKGAATTGAGLTMTLLSFTVTAGLGAAAFPVFGLAGAFIGIGINAAIQASKSQEVINTIREIGQLTLELSAEQNQAAAMRTIAFSLEQLSDQAGSSTVSMVGSLHHWEDVCGDLDLLRELLDRHSLDPKQLLALSKPRLEAAAQAWEKIVAGARSVQNSALAVAAPIEVKVAL